MFIDCIVLVCHIHCSQIVSECLFIGCTFYLRCEFSGTSWIRCKM